MSSATDAPPTGSSVADPVVTGDEGRFGRLRAYNAAMGLLHAVQGIVILVIANDFALPVTATFLEDAPGLEPPTLTELFEIRIAWGVAAFVLVSAVAHWSLATFGFGWYRRSLQRGRNDARWIEYSVSASIMIVLIAMLSGVSDVAALGALFGVNAAMILFGLLQERYEQPGSGRWLPYWLGVLVGAVPWVLVGVFLVSPGNDASPPGFVYGIFVSLFVLFNTFAFNMVLQYRRVGPWRDYLFGESTYVLLSLVAKSALAWQVFAGTLID